MHPNCTHVPYPCCCSAYYPCVSDEHYFATVVAFSGVDHESTCVGNVVHNTWQGGVHPRTYYMVDIGVDLLDGLRSHAGKCDAQESIR